MLINQMDAKMNRGHRVHHQVLHADCVKKSLSLYETSRAQS
jgi:hypothetical protein